MGMGGNRVRVLSPPLALGRTGIASRGGGPNGDIGLPRGGVYPPSGTAVFLGGGQPDPPEGGGEPDPQKLRAREGERLLETERRRNPGFRFSKTEFPPTQFLLVFPIYSSPT